MRKIGFLLLFIVSSLQIFSSDISIDGIYYNFDVAGSEAQVTFRGDEEDDGWMYYSASDLYVGDLVIPDSVTYEGATYKVTSIGKNAFAGSRQLTSIHFPASIKEFGFDVFPLCVSLHTVTVAEDNPYYFVYSGVMYQRNPTAIFFVPRALSGMIDIYEGVTEVPSTAFASCTNIEYVSIPSSVLTVKDGAFSGCTSLGEVAFSEGVTTIMRDAFSDCTALQIVSLPATVTTIGSAAFSGCSNLFYVLIKEGLETIGSYAFYGCSYISAISLPSTLQSIDDKAFYECYSLSSIRNNSSLDIVIGSETHGYVAYYATEIETTSVNTPLSKSNVIAIDGRTLSIYGSQNKNISLYDMLGNSVYKGVVPTNNFSILDLHSGIYVIQLDSEIRKISIK